LSFAASNRVARLAWRLRQALVHCDDFHAVRLGRSPLRPSDLPRAQPPLQDPDDFD
jgi:hypothetical protein